MFLEYLIDSDKDAGLRHGRLDSCRSRLSRICDLGKETEKVLEDGRKYLTSMESQHVVLLQRRPEGNYLCEKRSEIGDEMLKPDLWL